jgi:hypothetical protein
MNMQVKDGLTTVSICVYDDAITVIRKTFLACDLGGGQKQVSE